MKKSRDASRSVPGKKPQMTEPTTSSASSEPSQRLTADEDTLWAALGHLGGVVGILPSLIIFLALRSRGTKIAVEAKEALNWQITFLAGWLVVDVLVTIIGGIAVSAAAGLGGNPGLTLPLLLELIPAALWIVNIVLSILGFIKVNAGGSYRYPFAVRVIK
jgi:uncharacterized Tic20 family protein